MERNSVLYRRASFRGAEEADADIGLCSGGWDSGSLAAQLLMLEGEAVGRQPEMQIHKDILLISF